MVAGALPWRLVLADRTEVKRRPASGKLDLISRLGRNELALLAALVFISAGLWGFVELADDVGEGDTAAFDRALLLALRHPTDRSDPLGPLWFEELMRDFTALGGIGVLTFLTLAVGGYLLLIRRMRLALLVTVAVFGGLLLSDALKQWFERPRPDLVPHAVDVYTASFPSGHSMMSATAYLTLAALLARVQPRWRIKAYLLLMAIFLTLLVGISRVYLGVHWPTDVLGGWTLGAVWALCCWLVARWLQRRGAISPERLP
jgi:undecaprenyl-diphosphatase